MVTPCLIPISEYIKRKYGTVEGGAKPPTSQTIRRRCANGELPAVLDGGKWYIKWDVEQKRTGNDLVDRVLLKTRS